MTITAASSTASPATTEWRISWQRGISLDHGSPADDAMAETVCGLGNRNQERFLPLLADGVPVFDSTVALVRRLNRDWLRRCTRRV